MNNDGDLVVTFRGRKDLEDHMREKGCIRHIMDMMDTEICSGISNGRVSSEERRYDVIFGYHWNNTCISQA